MVNKTGNRVIGIWAGKRIETEKIKAKKPWNEEGSGDNIQWVK